MKKTIAVFLAAGALPALALEPVAWNGFWDTTAYVNHTPATATAESAAAVSFWSFDRVAALPSEIFETLAVGWALLIR